MVFGVKTLRRRRKAAPTQASNTEKRRGRWRGGPGDPGPYKVESKLAVSESSGYWQG
jgi:hypothetical protein